MVVPSRFFPATVCCSAGLTLQTHYRMRLAQITSFLSQPFRAIFGHAPSYRTDRHSFGAHHLRPRETIPKYTEQNSKSQPSALCCFPFSLPLQGESWTFTPNVHARWLNDWAWKDRFVAGSLSGTGGSYLVQGASAGRNYLVTGVGVSIDRGNSLRLIGDYTYQTSGKQASHTRSGALEVRW